MTNKQGRRNTNNSKDQTPPTPKPESVNPNEQSNESEQTSNNHKGVISKIKDWVNKCSISERIAILALLVNIILAVFTYSLYTVAISSLAETQKEFDIENRPFVSISNLEIKDFEIGKKSQITFDIINMGKQPAQIIEANYSFMADTMDNFIETDKAQKQAIENAYIINGANIGIDTKAQFPTTDKEYNDWVITGKKYIYIFGSIKYKSVSNKTIYTFTFDYRVSKYPTYSVKSIINKTE